MVPSQAVPMPMAVLPPESSMAASGSGEGRMPKFSLTDKPKPGVDQSADKDKGRSSDSRSYESRNNDRYPNRESDRNRDRESGNRSSRDRDRDERHRSSYDGGRRDDRYRDHRARDRDRDRDSDRDRDRDRDRYRDRDNDRDRDRDSHSNQPSYSTRHKKRSRSPQKFLGNRSNNNADRDRDRGRDRDRDTRRSDRDSHRSSRRNSSRSKSRSRSADSSRSRSPKQNTYKKRGRGMLLPTRSTLIVHTLSAQYRCQCPFQWRACNLTHWQSSA